MPRDPVLELMIFVAASRSWAASDADRARAQEIAIALGGPDAMVAILVRSSR